MWGERESWIKCKETIKKALLDNQYIAVDFDNPDPYFDQQLIFIEVKWHFRSCPSQTPPLWICVVSFFPTVAIEISGSVFGSLSRSSKRNPPPESKAKASEYIESNCSQFLGVYTDRSKTLDGDTDAAVMVPGLQLGKDFRLPVHASVPTCQLIAISMLQANSFSMLGAFPSSCVWNHSFG